ncbi:hypothetical protein P9Z26_24905, partial [Bacillus cereus]|nr:hypothetical protein [Bacillus cereus]
SWNNDIFSDFLTLIFLAWFFSEMLAVPLASENNLYDFRYFFVVYMSYLHCFILEIFILLGANQEIDEELKVYQEMMKDSAVIPNKEISLKWAKSCIKSLEGFLIDLK